MQGHYDGALICLNGHVINQFATSQPIHNTEFCGKCGAETLFDCPSCKEKLRGDYHVPGVISFLPFKPPSFCPRCGKAFPWTTSALLAARMLAEETQGLSVSEREELSQSLDGLVRDTPQTTVAATKFKRLAVKAGKGVAEGFKQVLVDVVSETAKKIIWP